MRMPNIRHSCGLNFCKCGPHLVKNTKIIAKITNYMVLYSLYFTLCTLNFISNLCTLHFVLSTLTLIFVFCTLYFAHCFLQMEFCENQTLRQLIDSGELAGHKERVWRLFREVVEGLEHIHSKVGRGGGRGERRGGMEEERVLFG